MIALLRGARQDDDEVGVPGDIAGELQRALEPPDDGLWFLIRWGGG